MVVPFPAGGSTDTLARIISERLRMALGHPVIIENVGGASGLEGWRPTVALAGHIVVPPLPV
jgi:tripartite-type tricarboxylate transporter receptor subunit TctC